MEIMPKSLAEAAIELLFPRRCPVCNEIVVPRGNLICPSCYKKLSFVKSPNCKKCGKEVWSDAQEYCFDCTRHKRSFEYGAALVNYNEAAKNSMVKIKYKNKREYLDFYAQEMIKKMAYKIQWMKADLLVPVPVHPGRRRQRGFNQAQVLAEKLGQALGIPVCLDTLQRSKRTAPQKDLTPAQRLKNLEKAFTVGKIPEGAESVILVDDIYTTGSTVEACTRVLKRSGVKRVYFLTICIGQGQ